MKARIWGSCLALAVILITLTGSKAFSAPLLRIGLQDDPDVLDPHRSRTYVGRIVYAALCDKLVDVTPTLEFRPRLALSWSWDESETMLTFELRPDVTFHDGEPFNAEAVKFNLDRARTLPDSHRKSELASIAEVEAVAPLTVRLKLKKRDATLMAQLSDRAGMMLSPKAAAGPDFGAAPVCSGPYKFVERKQQDRIVLERFPAHWNNSAYHFDRLIYLPIPDATVRLANLRAGDLDVIERPAATDLRAVAENPDLAVARSPGLGYVSLYFNLANGERAKTALAADKRVRQALELAIDRETLNKVVFDGRYSPGDQPFPNASPFFAETLPMRGRNIEKAKALLKEAGATTPIKAELKAGASPVSQQAAQVIQAMAAEAGFELSLRATEYATLLKDQQQGNFELSLSAWSGRIDPDGNLYPFVTCGSSMNDTRYCNAEVDRLLNEARAVNDQKARKALYEQALGLLREDLPLIYLYFEPRIFVMTKKLQGFGAHPDGLIRLEAVEMVP
jgi:peptide/nickel transport system substrate-binding protein